MQAHSCLPFQKGRGHALGLRCASQSETSALKRNWPVLQLQQFAMYANKQGLGTSGCAWQHCLSILQILASLRQQELNHTTIQSGTCDPPASLLTASG